MANSGNSKGVGVMPGGVGYQDMGGRVTRYPLRRIEKTPSRACIATCR